MQATQFSGAGISIGLTNRRAEWKRGIRGKRLPFPDQSSSEVGNFLPVTAQKRSCSLKNGKISPLVALCRKANFPVAWNHLSSDYGVGSSDVDEFLDSDIVETDLVTKGDHACSGSGVEAS